MAKLQLQVWSDIACPWCYVGKRRLEKALAGFAHAADFAIAWRAFELDPRAPREQDPSQSYAERLARKYGSSVGDAQARIDHLTETARGDGLTLRFDIIRPGNTFDAHRLVHLAATRGRQDAMKERLLFAYFSEGQSVADPETLARLGAEVGLDADDVRRTLSSDAYAQAVRAEERRASELGIGGVPFFVFADRYALSGAQPAEVFEEALTRAWTDQGGASPPSAGGAGCDGGGCEVAPAARDR
ncbi:MAG: DsbA family oxidoreductase [Myxococcales bacterium]|nr:DsbA family oxidoreductase [Myxococcales bacterium]